MPHPNFSLMTNFFGQAVNVFTHWTYDSPHKNRPTPVRLHYSRTGRKSLFKGHRK